MVCCLQGIVAKRQELLEARAAGMEGKEGGSHGSPPAPAGAGHIEEQEPQPQLDSGDCLVQSVSDMDLIDHEPLVSGKPALPHPQPTRLV